MTGKELIGYILDNDLLNEPVFKDGTFIGFMTDSEAAVKLDVGTATVRVWVHTGALEGIRIGDNLYIPVTSVARLEKELLCAKDIS